MTRLQSFVATTSYTPLRQLYLLIYRLAIWWIGKTLYEDEGVKAVYLKNDCARGEIVPGVSYIDLALIVKADGAPSTTQSIARNLRNSDFSRRYSRLANYIPMMDSSPDVYMDTQLEELSLTGYQDRFMLVEGRANWKLLRGKDYLADLPKLPPNIWYGALLTRVEDKWKLVVSWFLQNHGQHKDQLDLNSICYRFCCELLNQINTVRAKALKFSWEETIPAALDQLSGADKTFALHLEELKRRRFNGSEPAIVEKTKGFMLSQLNEFYGELWDSPLAQPVKAVQQRIDCPFRECFSRQAQQRHIQRLLDHLELYWPSGGAYLVPSVFFGVDDLLLLIEVKLHNLPTTEQMAALFKLHKENWRALHRPIRLFLLLPNVACYFAAESIEGTGWHNMLPKAFVPDIFQLIKRREFAVRRSRYPTGPPALFTLQAANFFWRQKLRFFQYAQSHTVDWTERRQGLGFMRSFWKCLQLEVITRTIETDEILYPLTLAAIERGLDKVGVPLPSNLQVLAEAYHKAVGGQGVDIAAHRSEALAYLYLLDPQGGQYTQVPKWLGG